MTYDILIYCLFLFIKYKKGLGLSTTYNSDQLIKALNKYVLSALTTVCKGSLHFTSLPKGDTIIYHILGRSATSLQPFFSLKSRMDCISVLPESFFKSESRASYTSTFRILTLYLFLNEIILKAQNKMKGISWSLSISFTPCYSRKLSFLLLRSLGRGKYLKHGQRKIRPIPDSGEYFSETLVITN